MKDAAKTKAQLIDELQALRQRNLELEAAAHDARRHHELRERYEWLQTILASIGDGVIVTDTQGRITFMNAVAETLTGWAQQDAAGTDLEAVFRIIDAISGAPVESLFSRVMCEGGVVGLGSGVLLVARDGTAVPIDDSCAPLRDERGALRGIVLIFRDITERQRAEDALRRSHDQLDAILRGVDDGITVQAPDGHLIYANDTAARICGYPSAEALVAAPLAEVMRRFEVMDEAGHRIDLGRLPGRLALQGQRVPDTLLRFRIHESGEERWSIVKATPVFDERGRVAFAINLFQDITAIKRAEAERERLLEQLTDERTLLEAVLQQLPAGVVITEAPSGRIILSNVQAEQIIRHPFTSATDIADYLRYAGILPADQPAAADSALVRAIETGAALTDVEAEFLRGDGTPGTMLVSSAPVRDLAGRTIAGVITFYDITERKRAEEARHFMAEASSVLAGSLDYETTLASVARLAVPYLADWCAVHMREADGMIRRLAVAHTDPSKEALVRDRPPRYPIDPNAQHIVSHVMRTGQPEIYAQVSDEVLASAARDDEHLELLRNLGFRSYMCVPLLARGNILGALTLATGGTGRRYGPDDLAMAEELAGRAAVAVDNAQLYRESQEAIQVRDLFLSIASHELKTPLTSLLGNAQLLARRAAHEGLAEEREQRIIRALVDQATRLNKMIAALLDISHIQNGQLSIERSRLDLSALVRRVVDEAQPTLSRHAIVCSVPDEELVVEGDDLRLEQVLQNLLNNAAKYSPAGGTITVRLERQGSQGCITVADQGIGIPRDALPQLFQRFYRAHNVETQHFSGMGVGLFVVKEIVTLHGGSVNVCSTEGCGSTFTVYLPLTCPATTAL